MELLQTKVPPEMKEQLRAIQEAKGITLSEQVRRALLAWIDQNQPDDLDDSYDPDLEDESYDDEGQAEHDAFAARAIAALRAGVEFKPK